MSLRAKLACALIAAALLPMAVALGTAMLRAGERARRDSAARAATASRQATLLAEQRRRDLRERMDHAAADLSHDYFGIESVLSDSGSSDSRAFARTLAGRHGLDHLEILSSDRRVVSCSRLEHAPGGLSPFAGLPEDEIIAIDPSAFALRTALPVGNAPLTIAGSLDLDARFLGEVREITGASASLWNRNVLVGCTNDVTSTPDAASGPGTGPAADSATGTIPVVVPLGSELELDLLVPAADAAGARRELLAILGGLAPFAVMCALAVGLLLAHRISAPIRTLAARADDITRRAGPLTLPALRDEVRGLTLSFERMLDALHASEQQRLSAERIAAWQDIARRIAHEVKNPLSPIRLAVQNLLRTYEKDPARFDRALREEAATILEEVDSLRRLVDEFSQFARLPLPVRRPCDPVALVESTLALFAGRIEQLGVAVDVRRDGAPVPIAADPELLGRALKNVVANALDAMEDTAERRLAVTVRSSASAIEFRVTDSGAGLTSESRRRLFEPYYTTRSDRGGTGLGLAIAHRIMADHGGMIAAEGAPGRGATIVLRLPAGAAGEPIEDAGSSQPRTATLAGDAWPPS